MTKPILNPYLNVSTAFTDKFLELDRIMFRWSPFLTLEESYKVLDTMEIYAKSKYEGNWTTADCYDFLKRTLGEERFLMVNMMEQVDNQANIQKVFGGNKDES
jgi:hypothetical protein